MQASHASCHVLRPLLLPCSSVAGQMLQPACCQDLSGMYLACHRDICLHTSSLSCKPVKHVSVYQCTQATLYFRALHHFDYAIHWSVMADGLVDSITFHCIAHCSQSSQWQPFESQNRPGTPFGQALGSYCNCNCSYCLFQTSNSNEDMYLLPR